MLRTEELEFEVVSRENNHLWLRILHGNDEGMRLSVPVRDGEHDPDEIETLDSLAHGDIIRAVLQSKNHEYPDWRVDDIESVGTRDKVRSPASAD